MWPLQSEQLCSRANGIVVRKQVCCMRDVKTRDSTKYLVVQLSSLQLVGERKLGGPFHGGLKEKSMM